jgi:hypothetical protein
MTTFRDRYTRCIAFQCDDCGSEAVTNCSDVRSAARAIRDDNWKVILDENENWTHYCDECEPPQRRVKKSDFADPVEDFPDDLMEDEA